MCRIGSLQWLNDREGAIDALERACRHREPCIVRLKVDPIFDPLRNERKFTDMVRSVGLEP